MGVLSDRQIRAEIGIEPFSPQQQRPGVISYGVGSYGYDVRCGYKFKVFSPIHATVIDPKNFDQKMLEEVDVTPYKHFWVDIGGYKTQCRYCNKIIQTNPLTIVEDEKALESSCSVNGQTKPDHVLIPPHSFALAESLETFTIPRDILCIVLGKSTYARCGLIVNVTPGEPEWVGKWTIELSNTTPLPIKVYAGEGIMQCLFVRADERLTRFLVSSIDKAAYTDFGFHEQLMLALKGSCEVSYADKKGKYQGQTGLTPPIVEGDKK